MQPCYNVAYIITCKVHMHLIIYMYYAYVIGIEAANTLIRVLVKVLSTLYTLTSIFNLSKMGPILDLFGIYHRRILNVK